MAIFTLPVLIGAGLGAAAGMGTAAALGPDEEPLWKKLLVGGSLGAVAGGLGGAALGPAATGTAVPVEAASAAGTAGTAGTAGGIAAGTGTAGTGATASGGLSPLLAASSGAEPVGAGTVLSLESTPTLASSIATPAASTVAPQGIAGGGVSADYALSLGDKFYNGARAVGQSMLDNKLVTGVTGLGLGTILLPGDSSFDDGAGKTPEYAGDSSLVSGTPSYNDPNRRRQIFRDTATNYVYTGGVGRSRFQ